MATSFKLVPLDDEPLPAVNTPQVQAVAAPASALRLVPLDDEPTPQTPRSALAAVDSQPLSQEPRPISALDRTAARMDQVVSQLEQLDETTAPPRRSRGATGSWADEPEQESWGETLRNIPTQVRSLAAQTIAGMKLQALEELQAADPTTERQQRIDQERAVIHEASLDTAATKGKPQSLLQKGVQGAASSLTVAGPALVAGILTRNPALAASTAYPLTEGQSYGEFREEGLAPEAAAKHSAVQGLIEVGTEALPAVTLFKHGTPAFKRLTNFLAAELPGESVATIGQTLDEHIAKLPGDVSAQDFVDGLKLGIEQLPETWATTIIAGGAQSGIASLADVGAKPRTAALTQAEQELADIEAASITDEELDRQITELEGKETVPEVQEDADPFAATQQRIRDDSELRTTLESMSHNAGWEEEGGKLLRKSNDFDDPDYNVITGRTKWIPRADWWPDRPKDFNETRTREVIKKALTDEPLANDERRYIEFLVGAADEQKRLTEYVPEWNELPDESRDNWDDAYETAMVARAAEIDEAFVERLAIEHEQDQNAFLRSIKGFLDGYDNQAAAAQRQVGEAASQHDEELKLEATAADTELVAEAQQGQQERVAAARAPRQAGPDLFGEDVSARQAIADETRRRDERRNTGQESAETGDPTDFFSQARQQTDLVDAGAHLAATSPQNELPEPSQAQIDAGNYRKGKLRLHGLDISIENPKGSIRRSKPDAPVKWQRTMTAHYGYVRGSEGADGDHVDVFIGKYPTSQQVFVIDQVIDGKFDEHKVVMGEDSLDDAKSLYLSNYQKNWDGLGAITQMPIDEFKAWVKSPAAKKPVAWKSERAASDVVLFSRSEPPAAFRPDAKEADGYRGELRKAMSSLRSMVAPIKLGRTSPVLRSLGARDLPIAITRDVVRKATNGIKHVVPMSAIEQLPEELHDPLAVFRSSTHQQSLVVLTEERDAQGATVIVAIDLRPTDKSYEINRIASVYGKDDAKIFAKWAKEGLLAYKSERASESPALDGLQLPNIISGNRNPSTRSKVLTERDIESIERVSGPSDGSVQPAGTRSLTSETASGSPPTGRGVSTAPDSESTGKPDAPLKSETDAVRRKLAELAEDPEPRRRQVEQAVRSVLVGVKGAPKVTVLPSVHQLPKELRERYPNQFQRLSARAARGIEGQYNPESGEVFIYADVVRTPERAQWVLFHELAGHHGIRVAAEQLGVPLERVLDRTWANTTVRTLAKEIAKRRDLVNWKIATDEALAELAAAVRTGDYAHVKSRYGISVPQAQRQTLRGLIARLMERIRGALAKAFGTKPDGFTDADVYALLETGWGAIKRESIATATENLDSGQPLYQASYHGSPHRFNRFDLSKIGSGEGAQAYGWGQYFSDAKEVGEAYRKKLAPSLHGFNYSKEAELLGIDNYENFRREFFRQADSDTPVGTAAKRIHNASAASRSVDGAKLTRLIELYRSGRQGQTYVVDIPDEAITRMLDWDRPLSEQSESVQAALKRAYKELALVYPDKAATPKTGGKIYKDIIAGLPTDDSGKPNAKAASEYFKELGIPGLRYLDQGSRNAGEGTRNTVIWDQALLDRISDNMEALYSQSATTKEAYEQRIDELFAGGKPNRIGARVLDRSDVLGLLGYADKPVVLAEGKVTVGQDNHPNMTADVWKRVPAWLDDPAAVFDSDTVPGSLVVIGPELIAGAPVRMVLVPDAQVGDLKIHLLGNAYDAQGGRTPWRRWFQDGLARYVNKQKFPGIVAPSGLQLSGVEQRSRGTPRILTEKHLAGYRTAQAGQEGHLFSEAPSDPKAQELARLKALRERRHAARQGMAGSAYVPMYQGGQIVPMQAQAVTIGAGQAARTLPVPTTPIRREHILAQLMRDFDVKVYQGKPFRGRMLGFFRPSNFEVRVKHKNDLEVTAHEIFHWLDYTYPELKRLYREKRFDTELRSISYDAKKLHEGFAEFGRLFMTQDAQAIARAPQFYAAFVQQAQALGIYDRLTKIQDRMHQWYMQGALLRAQSKIGETAEPLEQRMKALADVFSDRAIAESVDRLHAGKVIERTLTGSIAQDAMDSPYKSLRLLAGGRNTIESFLNFGTLDWTPRGLEFTGKSLKHVFEPVAHVMDDAMAYFVGRRAAELSRYGKERLFTADEIEALLDAGRKSPYAQDIEKAFDEYQAYVKRLMDFAESSGIVSRDTRDLWESMYQNYVPFYRVPETLGNTRVGNGPGAANPFKRLFGGTANVRDIWDNIVMNTAVVVQASLRNQAKQKLFAAIEKSPLGQRYAVRIATDTKSVEVGMTQVEQVLRSLIDEAETRARDPNATAADKMHYAQVRQAIDVLTGATNASGGAALDAMQQQATFYVGGQPPSIPDRDSVLIDGERVWFQIADPLLWDMLSDIGYFKPVGLLEKVFGAFKRTLTRGVTLTPEFQLANLIRDTLNAFTMSKGGQIPFVHQLGAMADIWTRSEDYKLFLANGGGFGNATPAEEGKRLRVQLNRLVGPKGRINIRAILDTPYALLDFWDRWGQSFELATRLAEFKRLKAKGASLREAAFEGREISSDFAMHGRSGVVRAAMISLPFTNARLQGLYRLERELFERGGKQSWRGERQVQYAMRGFLGITIPALLLYFLNKDDEDYRALPAEVRYRYYPIKIPDSHDFVLIPRPFETGAIFATIPEQIWEYEERRNSRKLMDAAAFMLTDTFAINPIPQIGRPSLEWYANRDWRGARVVPENLENVEPGEQFRWNTPESLVRVGKAFEVSPIALNHFLTGYFGGMASYVTMAADSLVTAKEFGEEPTKRLSEYPVARRFVREYPYPNTSYAREFWDLKKEIDRTVNTARKMRLETRSDDLEDYLGMREKEVLFGMGRLGERIADRARDISAAQISTRRDPSLSAQEKRQQIDDLQTELNDLFKEVVQTLSTEDIERYRDALEGRRMSVTPAEKLQQLEKLIFGQPRRTQITELRANGYTATADLVASLPPTPDKAAMAIFNADDDGGPP